VTDVYEYGFVHEIVCVRGMHHLHKYGIAAVFEESVKLWVPTGRSVAAFNELGREGWVIGEARYFDGDSEIRWLVPHIRPLVPDVQRVLHTAERFMRRRVS